MLGFCRRNLRSRRLAIFRKRRIKELTNVSYIQQQIPQNNEKDNDFRSLAFCGDGISLNSPDPCISFKDANISSFLAALEVWIDELDINAHRPRLSESCNLATLVPNNNTLHKLVELGVDLSKIETIPGVANMLVKIDFNTVIAPKLWLLTDYKFQLPQISRIITKFPKIITLTNEELLSRFAYFTDRGFSSSDLIDLVVQEPEVISLKSLTADEILGEIQSTFNFENEEIRDILVKGAANCLLRSVQQTKDVFVLMTKMMGFSLETTRSMVLKNPKILLSSHRVLSHNFMHLYRKLNLCSEIIALSPEALAASPQMLLNRTNFLVLLKLFQPDKTKPLFTPLDSIVQGDDSDFCDKFAYQKEDLYNEYLRTL